MVMPNTENAISHCEYNEEESLQICDGRECKEENDNENNERWSFAWSCSVMNSTNGKQE